MGCVAADFATVRGAALVSRLPTMLGTAAFLRIGRTIDEPLTPLATVRRTRNRGLARYRGRLHGGTILGIPPNPMRRPQ